MNDKSKLSRRRKERWPARAYGPEWKELWLRASRKAFYIDFKTPKELNRLRLMAQRYRNQQKQAGLEAGTNDWELLYLATTTIDDSNPLRLHFMPVAAPHVDYFAQVGIVVGEGQSTGIAPEPQAPQGADLVIDSVVRESAASSGDEDDFMQELIDSRNASEEEGEPQ